MTIRSRASAKPTGSRSASTWAIAAEGSAAARCASAWATAINILIKPTKRWGPAAIGRARAARGRVRRDEPGPSGTGRAESRRIPTTKDVPDKGCPIGVSSACGKRHRDRDAARRCGRSNRRGVAGDVDCVAPETPWPCPRKMRPFSGAPAGSANPSGTNRSRQASGRAANDHLLRCCSASGTATGDPETTPRPPSPMSSKAESPDESEVCGFEVEPAGACWPYDPPALFTGTGALYGTPTSTS